VGAVAPAAELVPNSEFPVVVEPKMLLPAPAAGWLAAEVPKIPVEFAVAGVPLPKKNDMLAVGFGTNC